MVPDSNNNLGIQRFSHLVIANGFLHSILAPSTTLNIPIIEGGTNSNHTHNLVKSQSYEGLKLLLSDTKFMTMVHSMLTYHRFQEN